MIFIIICLVSLGLSSATEIPYYKLDEAEQLFENFIITHKKIYPSSEEKQKRFEIFKENLKEINELNLISSAIRGINQFTDLTKTEFVNLYTLHPRIKEVEPDNCRIITDADITTNNAPESLDYRGLGVVTSVKAQNSCGSCWAFAATACIESQYAMKHHKLVRLSDQQIMDCTKYTTSDIGHCNGGLARVAMSDMIKNKRGIPLESKYPYIGKYQDCHETKSADFNVKLSNCIRLELSEEKLKEALYIYGPIAVSLFASTWQEYDRLVYDINDCPNYNVTNHEVLLVGYGSTKENVDYWLFKNSWGPQFGEEGYIRIRRGQNACYLSNPNTVVAVVE